MNSLTLEEVINAKSFGEIPKGSYIPSLAFIDNISGEFIEITRLCALTMFYQINLFNNKNTPNFPLTGDCKSPIICGNKHFDCRKYNRQAFCGLFLIEGKCKFGRGCKFLHVFENKQPSTTKSHHLLNYRPPSIQIPNCRECDNPLSTSETQQLNTSSSTSEIPQLNTSSSTSETQHKFSYSFEDYWKELAKITTEKIEFERQLNNLYSEYQIEIMKLKSEAKNKLEKLTNEIIKLKSELKNVTDKATSDREYYKEKIEYFQNQINRNLRYDDERERKRQRGY
jgi:archaellum component FlaC